jgi:hypothetical protein
MLHTWARHLSRLCRRAPAPAERGPELRRGRHQEPSDVGTVAPAFADPERAEAASSAKAAASRTIPGIREGPRIVQRRGPTLPVGNQLSLVSASVIVRVLVLPSGR